MAPKGNTHAKPKCEVSAAQICKVFKYHFTALPSGLTLNSDEDFAVLEKRMDFFVELWKTDPYVSENVLSCAVSWLAQGLPFSDTEQCQGSCQGHQTAAVVDS